MNQAWYRSWPEAVPADRAYVHDSLLRLVMRDCNYDTLAEYQPWPVVEPGFFLLEWDVALDRVERERFAEHALATPDRVLVAPYRKPYAGRPALVHRVRQRPIPDGQGWAHTFGFGCIYFPLAVMDRWWVEMPSDLRERGWFNDVAFSTWHYRTFGATTVDWSVHPQHLHGD